VKLNGYTIAGAVLLGYVLWRELGASASPSTPTCGPGETLGLFGGTQQCLHQGGVGFAGGDGSDTSSPVSNESVGGSLASAWNTVLSWFGGGPDSSSPGPITSPDQT